ncbi:MAG TPA: cellulase family glycosylhydrolase [Longimicrobium sp.]
MFPRYSAEDLRSLAAWGANYVNLSVPGPYGERLTGRPRRYHPDSRVWQSLDSMVAWSERVGLKVVISFRTGPGRSEFVFDPSEEPKITDLWQRAEAESTWVRMWAEAATRYRGRPSVVGYDLMVEPLLGPDNPRRVPSERWYRLARRIVRAIRRVDSTTPILVSVASGGDPEALRGLPLDSFDVYRDRLVFTIHLYAPNDYVYGESADADFECPGPSSDTPVPPGPLPPDVLRALDTMYDSIAAWKRDTGAPLAVNEFGVHRWQPGAEAFLERHFERLEELGVNHALWLWDPAKCLGWDEMNYRHGPNPRNHVDAPGNRLEAVIRRGWSGRADVGRGRS